MKSKWLIAVGVALAIAVAGGAYVLLAKQDPAIIEADGLPDVAAMSDSEFQEFKEKVFLKGMLDGCRSQFLMAMGTTELIPEQKAYCDCVGRKFMDKWTRENMLAYKKDKSYLPFTEEQAGVMAEECVDETR